MKEKNMDKKSSNSNSRTNIIFFVILIVCVLLLIVKIVTGFINIHKLKKVEDVSNVDVSATVDGTTHQKSVVDIEYQEPVKEIDQQKPDLSTSNVENVTMDSQLKEDFVTVANSYTDAITGMAFVKVVGGCYQMGDRFGGGRNNEKPVHEVCVDDFYIGKYEVTQGEYEKIPDLKIEYSRIGSDYPVEGVSWNDVQIYIDKLNNSSGKKYRLPTEAEWEYAARSGGKKEKYSGGDVIDDVAWYEGNYDYISHAIGTKKANGLGLYDMSGSVLEWCADWYSESYYDISPKLNPKGPSSGNTRVVRGGNWFSSPKSTRSSYRSGKHSSKDFDSAGFRLAFSDLAVSKISTNEKELPQTEVRPVADQNSRLLDLLTDDKSALRAKLKKAIGAKRGSYTDPATEK